MKRWSRTVAAVTGGAALGAAAAFAGGAFLWRRTTARAVARLNAAVTKSPLCEFLPAELALLPAPVQRYFLFALTPGQMLVRRARVVQDGMFRIGGFDAKWSPFTAVQHFTAQPPGFLWDARIQMAPMVTVRVRDSYIGGGGGMQVSIASLIPVVNQSGKPELAASALHRYLAEAVWLPTALLPSQGVAWEGIDDNSARATLTDGEVSVSLVFQFGDRGEIVSTYTPERYRDVNGTAVKTSWTCRYGEFARVNGMMIPMEGDAAWSLPEGSLSYCRVHLREMEFDGSPDHVSSVVVGELVHLQNFLHAAPRLPRRANQAEICRPLKEIHTPAA